MKAAEAGIRKQCQALEHFYNETEHRLAELRQKHPLPEASILFARPKDLESLVVTCDASGVLVEMLFTDGTECAGRDDSLSKAWRWALLDARVNFGKGECLMDSRGEIPGLNDIARIAWESRDERA